MSTTTVVNEALMQFLYRAPIGLVQMTLDGTVEIMNPTSAQLLMPLAKGGGLDNLFDVLEVVAPDLRSMVAAFGATNGVVCEGHRIRVDAMPAGGTRIYSLNLMKVDAERLMAVLDDVSVEVEREQQSVTQRLHDAARIDGLTCLPNRVAMTELVEAAMATPRAATPSHEVLLLIGCERLQQIGESFGDDARNGLLSLMASRLRGLLRPDDAVGGADASSIAARVAGDEFVVLVRRLARPEDAITVAQRILDALSKSYQVQGQLLHCPISIGIARLDRESRSADDVLRDAGIAMSEAKRVGGSRWVEFERAMRERAIRRGGVEMELRRALEQGELFVVYQPVIHLQHHGVEARPACVEALVRWRHPERGVVPPIDFIGVAEETGLIGALGAFVLQTACHQFMQWTRTRGDRAPQMLAVNLSRAQLGDDALIDLVRRVLATTGMPPERLQLEVTESLAAQDDGVQGRLHELKALGIALALDDFGTGYSSLSSLHLLPVDTVKIDRSFVTLLETSPHHRVLIEATILVSKSLGMTTVAEGIETQGQADIIRGLGCDKGQGYRFSRPLPADDLCRWLEASSAGSPSSAASA